MPTFAQIVTVRLEGDTFIKISVTKHAQLMPHLINRMSLICSASNAQTLNVKSAIMRIQPNATAVSSLTTCKMMFVSSYALQVYIPTLIKLHVSCGLYMTSASCLSLGFA